MEKSYLEIKVSFIHIVVLLAGVILIGTFLFYLGYQAGKSSVKESALSSDLLPEQSEEIQMVDEKAQSRPTKNLQEGKAKDPSISDEIRLHQLPSKPKTAQDSSAENVETKAGDKGRIKPKRVSREPYFSIQVGAFSDYTNAKKYAAKFSKMGYPTEINSTTRNSKKLYRVRVGHYNTRARAKAERLKLEKMEKKKFAIVRSE
jgi:cell division protein FtsN